VIESPAAFFAELENISEELLARFALDKDILLGGMLVTETRRNGHALHSERHYIVEKCRHLWRGLALK